MYLQQRQLNNTKHNKLYTSRYPGHWTIHSCKEFWLVGQSTHPNMHKLCLLTAESMAGSCGASPGLGISLTWRSLMSLPRKMMNSYVSLRGGMCFGTALSSVPKERTVATFKKTAWKQRKFQNKDFYQSWQNNTETSTTAEGQVPQGQKDR